MEIFGHFMVLLHAFRFEELKSEVLKYVLVFEKLMVNVSTERE